jgi:hypothetical protein
MEQFNSHIYGNVITSNMTKHYVSVSSFNIPNSVNTCCLYMNFQRPIVYSSEFSLHALNKSLKSGLHLASKLRTL